LKKISKQIKSLIKQLESLESEGYTDEIIKTKVDDQLLEALISEAEIILLPLIKEHLQVIRKNMFNSRSQEWSYKNQIKNILSDYL